MAEMNFAIFAGLALVNLLSLIVGSLWAARRVQIYAVGLAAAVALAVIQAMQAKWVAAGIWAATSVMVALSLRFAAATARAQSINEGNDR